METFLLRYPYVARFLPAVLITFATIIVYAGNISGEFLWDDIEGIVDNRYVHEPDLYFFNFFSEQLYAGANSVSYYWRPVVLMLFSVQWHFFNAWTPIYHAANIFFHALNGILIFYIFRKIFRRETAALFAAVVFAVHPLNTSVITFISGIADPLSVFFMLLGIFACLKAQENPDKQRLYLLFSGLLLVLALMTKESAIMMPFLALLCVLFAERAKIHSWKDAVLKSKPLWSLIAVVFLFILLRTTVLDFRENLPTSFSGTSFFERITTFFHAYMVYIELLFSPTHLHMERSIPLAKSLLSIPVASGLLLLSTTFILFFTEIKRRPAVSFGLAWFLLSLAPNSNVFIPTIAYIREHWLYLGLPGVFFALFIFLEEFFKKNKVGPFVAAPLIMIIVGTFGYVTIQYTRKWSNPITLFSYTINESPQSARAMLNLGLQYMNQKEYAKVGEMYERALAIDPNNETAYYLRALLYEKIGRKDDALADHEHSFNLTPLYSPSFRFLTDYFITHRKHEELREILETRLSQTTNPLEAQELLLKLFNVAVQENNDVLKKKYAGKLSVAETNLKNDPIIKFGTFLNRHLGE